MTEAKATMGLVFGTLADEGLVGPDWAAEIMAETDLGPPQPWYVRAMVGFGAWFGSLLLISAVVGMSVASTGGGYVVLGLLFMVAAVVGRRATRSDFTRQAAIATSLAGQVLLAVGVASAGSFDEFDAVIATLILTNALLIRIFPDRTHRFLSVLFIVSSLVSWVYLRELQSILPIFGPLLAWGAVVLLEAETRIVSRGLDEIMTPIAAGMLMSALGCLMLSTLYVLPQIAENFTFYPRPWISTLLLGALLFYVQRDIWSAMFGDPKGKAAMAAYGVTAVVIVASLPAPGLTLALLVMALGLVHGSPMYAGTGVVFLVVFTGGYFYGIDTTMLTKSGTLVGTGVAILFARRALIHLADRAEGGASA
jgi:hypothetical protein